MKIEIYTDGSCHTQLKIGAWAAILLFTGQEIVLKGIQENTTHNQMEILAVIKCLEYLKNENLNFDLIEVYSDSQYVIGLLDRKEKLLENNFMTSKGKKRVNEDLILVFFESINSLNIEFIKVKAHLKESNELNFNRKVDKIVRKLLREVVK